VIDTEEGERGREKQGNTFLSRKKYKSIYRGHLTYLLTYYYYCSAYLVAGDKM